MVLPSATRSKSAFRVLGTLIGAVAAVVMVPNLVDAPELLVLAMAGWTGLCLYVSLLDRTPRSYVFMLGGYTAALINYAFLAHAVWTTNDVVKAMEHAQSRAEISN